MAFREVRTSSREHYQISQPVMSPAQGKTVRVGEGSRLLPRLRKVGQPEVGLQWFWSPCPSVFVMLQVGCGSQSNHSSFSIHRRALNGSFEVSDHQVGIIPFSIVIVGKKTTLTSLFYRRNVRAQIKSCALLDRPQQRNWISHGAEHTAPSFWYYVRIFLVFVPQYYKVCLSPHASLSHNFPLYLSLSLSISFTFMGETPWPYFSTQPVHLLPTHSLHSNPQWSYPATSTLCVTLFMTHPNHSDQLSLLAGRCNFHDCLDRFFWERSSALCQDTIPGHSPQRVWGSPPSPRPPRGRKLQLFAYSSALLQFLSLTLVTSTDHRPFLEVSAAAPGGTRSGSAGHSQMGREIFSGEGGGDPLRRRCPQPTREADLR